MTISQRKPGVWFQVLQLYGVGIDTHSKFIAVCVMRQRERAGVKFEAEFTTDWASLLAARQWITDTLEVRPGSPFRSCIESTGTCHSPVRIDADLQAGVPKVRLVWTDGQSADLF